MLWSGILLLTSVVPQIKQQSLQRFNGQYSLLLQYGILEKLVTHIINYVTHTKLGFFDPRLATLSCSYAVCLMYLCANITNSPYLLDVILKVSKDEPIFCQKKCPLWMEGYILVPPFVFFSKSWLASWTLDRIYLGHLIFVFLSVLLSNSPPFLTGVF